MESTLGLEIIEVVEQAAIASAKWMGKGEKNIADQVAVEAMRERMNKIYMRGRIVIGEGERDDAPMLYIGMPINFAIRTSCWKSILPLIPAKEPTWSLTDKMVLWRCWQSLRKEVYSPPQTST